MNLKMIGMASAVALAACVESTIVADPSRDGAINADAPAAQDRASAEQSGGAGGGNGLDAGGGGGGGGGGVDAPIDAAAAEAPTDASVPEVPRDAAAADAPPSAGSPALAPDGTRAIFPTKPGGIWMTNGEARYFTRHYASGKPDDPTVELTFTAPSGHQQDIEATAIVTLMGMNHNDTIDWKIRGPGHSDGSGKAWYCIDQETDGGFGKTLQVERPHPSMHDANSKTTKYFSAPNISTRTFGWKGITVNNGPGDVYIAAWINLTPFDAAGKPNPDGWQKLWDVHDTGQITNGQITPPTGGNIQIRIDGIKGKPTFQFSSIREIDYAEASAMAK